MSRLRGAVLQFRLAPDRDPGDGGFGEGFGAGDGFRQGGGIFGGTLLAWAMDRKGTWQVLACSYLAAAVFVVALGCFVSVPAAAVALLVCSLVFIDGGFAGAMAVTTSSYPIAMRATATGWISGIARLIGGSTVSLAGGFIVAAQWKAWQTGLFIAMLLAAGALVLVAGILLKVPDGAAADKG